MPAGFALLQSTGNVAGTGSLAFTLGAASTAKSALIATVVGATTTPSTPPSADWRLAKRVVTGTAGMIETWLYRPSGSTTNNPGGVTSFTFTGAGGVTYRGSLTEVMPPGGTDVILHTPGAASGASGTSFPVTTATGNVAGVFGWAVAADFFNANVPAGNTWGGLPAGWTSAQNIANGPPFVYRSMYHLNLPAAASTSMTPTFGYTTGQLGWAVSVTCFRARVFRNVALDGAEVSTMLAIDPTGQAMIMGGDVEGIFRTVTPAFGDQWEQARAGCWQDHWGQAAVVAWSPWEAGAVYAGVGKNNDGGFLASTDGGITWAMRSTAVQFVGNNARSPLPTSFDARSTGNLLAFDVTGHIIYAATYNGGIARSADNGATWTVIGLAGGNFYPRTLVINPDNANELWAGCFDWDGTGAFGKVWHCTTASTAAATTGTGPFTQDTSAPPVVEELRVVGAAAARYLYAACGVAGIYRFAVGGSGWTHLTSSGVIDDTSTTNGGSLWTTVDGYVDGAGKHQIIAACGNGIKQGANAHYTHVVKIADAIGTPAYSDLTGAATITTATIPPDARTFWKGSSWYGHLGNSGFTNPHVLIDPGDPARNTVYVAGYGGAYRTTNGGSAWDMPVNGANMSKFNAAAVDPLDPGHIVAAGSDTEQSDLRDPTGADPSKWFNAPFPVKQAESHAVALDPKDGRIYGGTNTKYGEKTGGGVFWRAPAAAAGGASSKTWNDTGYTTPAGGKAVIGLYAGRDNRAAPGNRFALAVAQGAGMWRWDGVAWSPADATVGTSGQVQQHCPFASDGGATIYVFDRGQAVYRSTDYGRTWTQIWVKAVTDIRTGWLALNPAVPGELWVSCDDGLHKLSGAGAGTVAGGQITHTLMPGFAGGAGGAAFGPDGNLYVVQLASASATSNLLVVTTNPGAASPAWQDVSGGDGSFSGYAALPAQLLITPAGLIWCITDTNQAVYGTIATIAPAVVTITTTTVPAGTVSVAYPSTTLAATGGTGTGYAWALAPGSPALPAGLSLSAGGVVTGTPTAAGTTTVTVQVTDSGGNIDTQALTFVIAAAVTVTTTSPLAAGTVGVAYSVTLAAAGGAGAPYAWTQTGGVLPPGLSLTSAGVIQGTPAGTGTFVVTATATDTAGRAGSAALSITISGAPLTIQTGALAAGILGRSYSAAVVAAGGTPPYTLAVTAGGLPPGLALTAGTISGTPTAAGTWQFTITVTDAASGSVSAAYTITIYPPAPAPAPAGPWRFLYGLPQPAATFIDEVLQAQNKTLTLRCQPGQNHEVSFDIDGRSAPAAGIAELQTDIAVLFGGQIVFAGRAGATSDQLDAGAHVTTVTASDYREVLRRRDLLPGDTLSWTATEQATIAWNLIQAAQGHNYGNLGITRGLGQATGTKRDYTATLGDYVADDIDTLAQMVNGFEWQINPYGLGDLRLDIYAPFMGADRGVVLALGDDRIASITRQVDPSTYANAAYVTGDSSVTPALTAQSLLADGIGVEGRWDTVTGTTLKTQSALNDYAAAALAQAQVLVPSYTVVFRPGAWGGPGDLWIGDTVTLVINSGRLQVNNSLRVVEMSFAVSADNVETLTATIGRLPFRPHKEIPKMLKRLRYLETR